MIAIESIQNLLGLFICLNKLTLFAYPDGSQRCINIIGFETLCLRHCSVSCLILLCICWIYIYMYFLSCLYSTRLHFRMFYCINMMNEVIIFIDR